MAFLTQFQAWYGKDNPSQKLLELQAGPISVKMDGIDLRYLQIGDIELVRRIYVTVRDQNWNTIPGKYEIKNIRSDKDSFTLDFEVSHQQQNIDFRWNGRIAGDVEGTIRYEMDGKAFSDFPYNRIGFCILHPFQEYGGKLFRAVSPEGMTQGNLPEEIGPQLFENGSYVALMKPFNSLHLQLTQSLEVEFSFEGDLFEMEDQRNWTDASFKTYCTPLVKGFPHQAVEGQTIRQCVTIKIPRGAEKEEKTRVFRKELSMGTSLDRTLPSIGFGMTQENIELSRQELTLLSKLQPAHLRVDLHLRQPVYVQTLKRAIQMSKELTCGLEIALFLEETDTIQLEQLSELLKEVEVARFLIFQESAQTAHPSETTSAQIMRIVNKQLRPVAPNSQYVGGTDMYFCELNRTRPDVSAMDAICYSIHPQQHAFDNLSIIETLQAQAETVRTAKTFCRDKPIVISPITLKRRSNLNATVPQDEQIVDEQTGLPDAVDPRQLSLLAADWTLGSVKYLSEAGVHSVTYYQLAGWLGLLEPMTGSLRPKAFPSLPGMVFPLYHVFADLAELNSARLVSCESSHPLELIGMAFKKDTQFSLLAANMTSSVQEIQVSAIVGKKAYIRRLNETNIHTSMLNPETFREIREEVNIVDRQLTMSLNPYEYVRIDI